MTVIPPPGGTVVVTRRGITIGGIVLLIILVFLAWLIYTNSQLRLQLAAAVKPVPPGTSPLSVAVATTGPTDIESYLTPQVTPRPGANLAAATPVPPAPATAVPAVASAGSTYAQGRMEQGPGGSIHLFVANPEAGDQLQTRHPAIYSQTGVANTPIQYTLDIPANYVGIVGGFKVDSTSGGVYQVLPPGHVVKTITDGFALIVRSPWARDEWNFRVSQAKDLGWAITSTDAGPLK